MGVTDVLSRKSGVIVGDDVYKLFQYAQEKQFAVPAIVRLPTNPPGLFAAEMNALDGGECF